MKLLNPRDAHPSEEHVLAAREGGMASEESDRIREHVSHCATCRERLRQLQAELQLFETAALPSIPVSALESGLQTLRKRISTWNEAHPVTREAAPEPRLSQEVQVREWLASELSIYLGMQTARSLVLQACDRPGVNTNDLTAVIEPVVSGFFGRRTGAAVAAQVVRIWNQAQERGAQSGATR
jgi:hypothetical protein